MFLKNLFPERKKATAITFAMNNQSDSMSEYWQGSKIIFPIIFTWKKRQISDYASTFNINVISGKSLLQRAYVLRLATLSRPIEAERRCIFLSTPVVATTAPMIYMAIN